MCYIMGLSTNEGKTMVLQLGLLAITRISNSRSKISHFKLKKLRAQYYISFSSFNIFQNNRNCNMVMFFI